MNQCDQAENDRDDGLPYPGGNLCGSSGYAGWPYTTSWGARIRVTFPFSCPRSYFEALSVIAARVMVLPGGREPVAKAAAGAIYLRMSKVIFELWVPKLCHLMRPGHIRGLGRRAGLAAGRVRRHLLRMDRFVLWAGVGTKALSRSSRARSW
jgi:hypothetical protein